MILMTFSLAFTGTSSAYLDFEVIGDSEEIDIDENMGWINYIQADSNTAYVADTDDNLVKVDLETGDVEWTAERGTTDSLGLSPNGEHLVSGEFEELVVLDVETGEVLWTEETPDNGHASAITNEGTAFIGHRGEGELTKADEDGQIWTEEGLGSVYDVEYKEGNIYVGYSDNMARWDTDASEDWIVEDFDRIEDVEIGENNVYGADNEATSDNEGVLHALDRETGEEVWTFEGFSSDIEAITVQESQVVGVNEDGEVKAVDKETGELEWVYQSGYSSIEDLATGENILRPTSDYNLESLEVTSFLVEETDEETAELEEEDYYNTATGDFAASTGIAALGGAIGGIGIWEGVQSFLFGTDDNEAQIFEYDVRSNAAIIEEDRKMFLNQSELVNDLSFGQTQAEARLTGIEDLNQNMSRQEAIDNVREDMNDYYSDMMMTVIASYGSEVINVEQDQKTAESLDTSLNEVTQEEFSSLRFIEFDYPLPNDEYRTSYAVVDEESNIIADIRNADAQGLTTDGENDTEAAQYLESQDYYDALDDISTARVNALTSADEIVDNIFEEFESGEISAEEVLGPLEVTQTASTDFEETGSYIYPALVLEQTGTPTNLSQSFVVEYEGENYTGSVHATEAVVGEEIQVGETYDGSQGEAFMVAQFEDTAERVNLESEFTVNEITDVNTGDSLDSTQLQSNDFYTEDISDLREELEAFQESQEELSDSSGGFGGFGGDLELEVAVIGVLGLLLLGGML